MHTMSAGSSGTQTSQGSGKHKDKQNFQAEVFQPNKDKLHVKDLITGGKEKLSVGTSGLTTGQNLQGGDLGGKKLQLKGLHQIKEKSDVQDSSSSGT